MKRVGAEEKVDCLCIFRCGKNVKLNLLDLIRFKFEVTDRESDFEFQSQFFCLIYFI